MKAFEQNLPVSVVQVMAWLRQCSPREKQILLKTLMGETVALTIASEPSLAKDWSGADEDEAWKDL